MIAMDDKFVASELSSELNYPCRIPVETLKRLVSLSLGAKGAIYPIRHCRENMLERGFDMADVIHVLETGDYEKYPAKWRQDHNNWLYFVVGEDLEEVRLKIVFSVEEADSKIRIISGERFFGGKRV